VPASRRVENCLAEKNTDCLLTMAEKGMRTRESQSAASAQQQAVEEDVWIEYLGSGRMSTALAASASAEPEKQSEQQQQQQEIIKDKVRKVAMCGDQNRIQNSNLLDKMASIAGQIAIVARMGDEDEDNEGDSDSDGDDDATSDTDDIDDR
jgi:hypothetical protein